MPSPSSVKAIATAVTPVVYSADTITAVSAAVIAFISAAVAFFSYRASLKNHKEEIVWKINQNLDDCYIELSNFVNKYLISSESPEKRIERDKILYQIEVLRCNIEITKFISDIAESEYVDLGLKISDITYENNFEKVMRDLGAVTSSISELKKKISSSI